MNLFRLRYFYEVATHGTFHSAAADLNVAVPVLWRQVRLFERELGLPLLERAGRGVRLTTAGTLLYERAKAILPGIDELGRLADDLRRGMQGRIRIGCGYPHIPRFLEPLVSRFESIHPNVQIQLWEYPRTTEQEHGVPAEDLADRKVDLLTSWPGAGDFEGFPIYNVRLVAVFQPEDPRTKQSHVPIESLRDQPIVTMTTSPLRRTLEEACHLAGFEPRIAATSNFPLTVVSLSRMGRGVPVLGDDVLAMAGNPAGVLITDARGPLSTPVWLYWRKDAPLLPATQAFIAEARSQASAELRR